MLHSYSATGFVAVSSSMTCTSPLIACFRPLLLRDGFLDDFLPALYLSHAVIGTWMETTSSFIWSSFRRDWFITGYVTLRFLFTGLFICLYFVLLYYVIIYFNQTRSVYTPRSKVSSYPYLFLVLHDIMEYHNIHNIKIDEIIACLCLPILLTPSALPLTERHCLYISSPRWEWSASLGSISNIFNLIQRISTMKLGGISLIVYFSFNVAY